MQSVLITGATGSFGTNFIRTLLPQGTVKRIVVFSRDEWKQAMLAEQLGVTHDNPRVRFFLGDVRDRDRLTQAMHGVDVVVHAAALKRVDAVSYNPTEVRRTNIDGTENVCLAAIAARVAKVVVLTSDKGVMPTNIYGATKMMAEQITVNCNNYAPGVTRLACVRYGNVVGSRGSVVEIWRRQLAQGLPLALTHREMTRFWLTLDDAANVVQRALTCMRGGEIFVPKLHGMRLVDLLEVITEGHDCKVEVTGLRPGGEKLHEVLMGEHELALDRGLDWAVVPEPGMHPWTTDGWVGTPIRQVMASNTAPQLTKDTMRRMLSRF